MTQSGGVRRARTEDTRSRLFDAALEAFSRNGFHGTTTRDIAAAAGMSPGALYVHHKSKEELLFLISLAGHETTLEVVRRGRASSTDPTEQLVAVVGEFAAHHARGHVHARVVNYEHGGLAPEHQPAIRELRREIEATVLGIIEDGVASGQFDVDDPAMTAVALLSLGIDVSRWYREEGAWTPEQIGAFYVKLALRIVGAR